MENQVRHGHSATGVHVGNACTSRKGCGWSSTRSGSATTSSSTCNVGDANNSTDGNRRDRRRHNSVNRQDKSLQTTEIWAIQNVPSLASSRYSTNCRYQKKSSSEHSPMLQCQSTNKSNNLAHCYLLFREFCEILSEFIFRESLMAWDVMKQ